MSGEWHTITLSYRGVVHAFGQNVNGQLGLLYCSSVTLPTRIPILPKIKQIACGAFFTVCVDIEGFLWSFGQNHCGQLGIGNTSKCYIPQKIQDIPPVQSVACGFNHTCIITNNSDLWSCGSNTYQELCLENQGDQSNFQKTKFSNVVKVSLGDGHTLFQNKDEEIYSCGLNKSGELGLGHFNFNQSTPTPIPNLPPNIVQFVCGYEHNLFLDDVGNAYSVGYRFGQLGNQNVLNQIPNIPPIKTISCVFYSSYLIDFEGNVWSFGNNREGQLGHGDKINRSVPTKIERLKDIQQISYGCCGNHFLCSDSQNKIFVMGYNANGELGTGNVNSLSLPTELNSKYSKIWEESIKSRAKSARK